MFANVNYDLAIIGGGIIGVMAAYQISQYKPNWRVLLIDKSMIGSGATYFSLAMSYPFGANSFRRELVAESDVLWKQLSTKIKNLHFNKMDFYGITSQNNMGFALNQYVFPQEEPLRVTGSASCLMQTWNWLTLQDSDYIIHGTSARYLSPIHCINEINCYLKEYGNIDLIEGVEVLDIQAQNNGNMITTSVKNNIYAKKILLATGPWLLQSMSHKIAQLFKLRIKKIVSLHFNKVPAASDPLIFLFDDNAFFLPVLEKRQWCFSFTAQTWDCQPNANQLIIDDSDQNLAFSIINRYAKDLLAHYQGGRVFCDAYGPDCSPVVSLIDGLNNAVLASGGSGSGFRLAPAIAARALTILLNS